MEWIVNKIYIQSKCDGRLLYEEMIKMRFFFNVVEFK